MKSFVKAVFFSSKMLEKDLKEFISQLVEVFCSDVRLDPMVLAITDRAHDPEFWIKTADLDFDEPVLLVNDGKWHAWRFSKLRDISCLLGQTTGYSYWIIDSCFRHLIYVDDHDCVCRAMPR